MIRNNSIISSRGYLELKTVGSYKSAVALLKYRNHGRFFFPPILNSHIGRVESRLGPFRMSATSGLLHLPRAIVRIENLME
jgi:hypothetical protein